MPHLELRIGELRSGYGLNPPMCGIYPLEYSPVYNTSQLDRGQPAVHQGPGPMQPPPSCGIGPGTWSHQPMGECEWAAEFTEHQLV